MDSNCIQIKSILKKNINNRNSIRTNELINWFNKFNNLEIALSYFGQDDLNYLMNLADTFYSRETFMKIKDFKIKSKNCIDKFVA